MCQIQDLSNSRLLMHSPTHNDSEPTENGCTSKQDKTSGNPRLPQECVASLPV